MFIDINRLIGNSIELIGYTSFNEYKESNLYNLIKREVLSRDSNKCTYLLCKSSKLKPATELVFLHNSISTYLGIGCFVIAPVCSDCYALQLKYQSIIFMLSGIRTNKGNSRFEIGRWYGGRFIESKDTARRIYKQLGKTYQNLIRTSIRSRIEREKERALKDKGMKIYPPLRPGEIGKNYVEYLGLKGFSDILQEC